VQIENILRMEPAKALAYLRENGYTINSYSKLTGIEESKIQDKIQDILAAEKGCDKIIEFKLAGTLYHKGEQLTLDIINEKFLDFCEAEGWEFCGSLTHLE
jgi:hypothetical protein